MGYRSEVISMLPLSEKKKADKIINPEDWDHVLVDEENKLVYYYALHWKWYHSWEPIGKWEDLISDLDEKGKDACLIAVGEDGAIHTEIGCPWDHEIYAETVINCQEIDRLIAIKEAKETLNEQD